MPRPRAEDPLVQVGLRLPRSLAASLRAQAAARGCTLADVFRSHLSLAQVQPLGRPAPQRRRPKRDLPAHSGQDLALLAQLSRIGNLLNQAARQANTARAVDAEVLAAVVLAERQLARLERDA